MSDLDDFELDEFLPPKKEPTTKKPKATSEEWCSKDLADQAPPYVNYDKKYEELQSYNFELDSGSDISDIIVYIEKLQKNRSRMIEMEHDAEKNYASIKMTYEVLFAMEVLDRPEKNQKDRESGALVKLKLWAKAESDAKVYAGACKRFREQIDATHHLLTKILNAKQLEVQLKAYEVRNKEGGSKMTPAYKELDWEDS